MYNQGGTVSPFLSWLAYQILSLTNKYGITLIPAHIPTHLNMEADYLFQDHLLPEWHLLLQVAQAAFLLWGLPEVDLMTSSCSSQCQYCFITTSGGLGVECLHLSLDLSGKLCVSSSSSSASSSVQVSGRTCQWSTQTFHSGGTMLDGGSLAFHSCSQHVGRCSSVVSHHERSPHGCFGKPGAQGSVISALTLWQLSNVWYADRDYLPQPVRWWQG